MGPPAPTPHPPLPPTPRRPQTTPSIRSPPPRPQLPPLPWQPGSMAPPRLLWQPQHPPPPPQSNPSAPPPPPQSAAKPRIPPCTHTASGNSSANSSATTSATGSATSSADTSATTSADTSATISATTPQAPPAAGRRDPARPPCKAPPLAAVPPQDQSAAAVGRLSTAIRGARGDVRSEPRPPARPWQRQDAPRPPGHRRTGHVDRRKWGQQPRGCHGNGAPPPSGPAPQIEAALPPLYNKNLIYLNIFNYRQENRPARGGGDGQPGGTAPPPPIAYQGE